MILTLTKRFATAVTLKWQEDLWTLSLRVTDSEAKAALAHGPERATTSET